MRSDESPCLASRFSSDSTRSPTWANTATSSPSAAASPARRKGANQARATNAAASANAKPPTAPSSDLRGEIARHGRVLPNHIPIAKAPTSQLQVTKKASSTQAAPPHHAVELDQPQCHLNRDQRPKRQPPGLRQQDQDGDEQQTAGDPQRQRPCRGLAGSRRARRLRRPGGGRGGAPGRQGGGR